MPQPDLRTDEQLIAACNAGDERAFDALYYRYRDWVVALAHRFTGNADDALDVLQDTFTYIARKLPTLRLTARMTTFLYPVVKNLAATARRKQSRSASEHSLASIQANETPDAAVARIDLAVALANLPEPQREALLLRFIDGFSLEEIALAQDVPVGTVKSRLHNAIAMLRDDPRVRRYFDQ